VKRYSSGMTVRLGFAIAAHLEPEILVVDEVLAVGDAEFQKKAIGKMQDVSRGEGRTVLFVSHNMSAVKNLCKRGIVLDQGQVVFDNDVEEAVGYYTNLNVQHCEKKVIINDRDHRDCILPKDLEFIEAEMLNEDIEHLATDEPLEFRVKLKRNNPSTKHFTIGSHIVSSEGNCEVTTISPIFSVPPKTFFEVYLKIKEHSLAKGMYTLYFNTGIKATSSGTTDYDIVKNVLFCQITRKKFASQESYTEWQKSWGSHYVTSLEYKVE
jgi:lipopolysaccharide transport system ATP-binding protein